MTNNQYELQIWSISISILTYLLLQYHQNEKIGLQNRKPVDNLTYIIHHVLHYCNYDIIVNLGYYILPFEFNKEGEIKIV